MELTAESEIAWRPLLATILAVAALLVLILRFRIPAFAALIGVSLLAALAAGFAPADAYDTIVQGMGGTLGFIAVVIGLGALFGGLLEAGGGLPKLAGLMLPKSGKGGGGALGFIGLLAAIPVFFDVALIILAPLTVALARRSAQSVMRFGIPLLAGLAIAHAFIPPTPGPVAVAEILGADLGWVVLAGLATGVPALLLAGPGLADLLDRAGLLPAGRMRASADEPPAATMSGPEVIALILLPLVLILVGTIARMAGLGGIAGSVIVFVGHPFAALLIACGLAALAVARRGSELKNRVSGAIARALEPAGAVILVTGAGGAFKQVLVDTGAGAQLAQLALALGLAPIVGGYVLAVLVRVAQGSATVAMITAAGLTAPLLDGVAMSEIDKACLVIAIAAGASALSHVNDSGFWLVSRIFGLSEAETLRSWTLLTLVLSVTGFSSALAIAAIV